jgi:hypothetical protein
MNSLRSVVFFVDPLLAAKMTGCSKNGLDAAKMEKSPGAAASRTHWPDTDQETGCRLGNADQKQKFPSS